jgi:hypothetical protein
MAADYKAIVRMDANGAYPASVVAGPGAALGTTFTRPPGVYAYGGVAFDLSEEGFYSAVRVSGGTMDGGPIVVYQNNVERLMGALCWLTRYGRTDESLTPAQLMNLCRERSVALRCGYTIELARYVCNQLSIPSRIVRLITGELPFTDFDDGHVALEVKIGGAWKLFDLAGDVCFKDMSTGALMSLNDVYTVGMNPLITHQLAPSESAPTPWSSTAFACEQYFNIVSRFNSDQWRQRIYQCVGIDHNGQCWWKLPVGADPALSSAIAGLATYDRVKSAAEWDATFYP